MIWSRTNAVTDRSVTRRLFPTFDGPLALSFPAEQRKPCFGKTPGGSEGFCEGSCLRQWLADDLIGRIPRPVHAVWPLPSAAFPCY
jgi:hypothetical protein